MEGIDEHLKFHHLGIVVADIKNALSDFCKFFQFDSISEIENIESQSVRVCFMKLGEIRFELIEPIGNSSPVLDFAEKGGGYHHTCFETDNMSLTIKRLINNGAKLIVKPTTGFEGRTISFLFLNSTKLKTNLIELVEKV